MLVSGHLAQEVEELLGYPQPPQGFPRQRPGRGAQWEPQGTLWLALRQVSSLALDFLRYLGFAAAQSRDEACALLYVSCLRPQDSHQASWLEQKWPQMLDPGSFSDLACCGRSGQRCCDLWCVSAPTASHHALERRNRSISSSLPIPQVFIGEPSEGGERQLGFFMLHAMCMLLGDRCWRLGKVSNALQCRADFGGLRTVHRRETNVETTGS